MTIRRRLTLGITAIVLGCLAVAFTAVYAGTVDEVRSQLDDDLHADMQPFSRVLTGVGGGEDGVRVAAAAYVGGQPYRPNSRLLFARIPGRAPITNTAALTDTTATTLAGRRARRILQADPGVHAVRLPDGSRIRLLVRRVSTARGMVTLGVGESTRLIDRAQDGVLRSFLLAGVLALLLASIAAVALATRIARPLRRMAAVAARVKEGDLGPRMGGQGQRDGDDVAVLADAFDSMLDRLQAAFDRQRAFVADASHELRTPLTVIRGQLEVLALDPRPEVDEVRRVDRLVRLEVDRMDRMVADLLTLAGAQDDAFLRLRPLRIPATTAELLDAQRATADRDFRHEPHTHGILVADPDRVAQAVRNLLRNAIEHTGEGGRVTLWVDAADDRVTIGVDDDGPGIPAAERERVFDRFHRADAHGPRGTGTGLGLAIVQAIALAHGGRSWAEDAPGGGARVMITLPRYTPDPT